MAIAAQASVDHPYASGWARFQGGDAEGAGTIWTTTGDDLLHRERSTDNLRLAAFAQVLATIAFEQAGDARAYQSWANALRYYLEAGTNWDAVREELRKRVRRNTQAMIAEGVTPKVSDMDLIVIELEQTLQLLDYVGPKAGLRSGGASGPPVNVSVQYFPGAATESSAAPAQATESRYEAIASAEKGAEDGAARIGARALTLDVPEEPASDVSRAVDSIVSEAAPVHELSRVLSPPSTAAAFGAADQAIAQRAWSYVVANRQSQTGLVNSKDGYAFVTVADIGHAMAAYVAAEGLRLIELDSFLADSRQLLSTLKELPLYAGELFNRDYDARSGQLVNLAGRGSSSGSGWSAGDLGRLLVWLKIVERRYPDLAEDAAQVVARLNFTRLVAGGRLSSALLTDSGEKIFGDTRIGMQQYVGAGLALWGVNLADAFVYEQAQLIQSGGQLVVMDRRAPGNISPELFPQAVIELGGFDGCFERIGRALLDAQLDRKRREQRPTMLADELLDRAPWFVYSSVYAQGEPWRVATYADQSRPDLRNFSTKAAFLWDAVLPTREVHSLRVHAESFENASRGYFAGRYESGEMNRALTLSTNAAILEAIFYVSNGRRPLLRFDSNAAVSCPFRE